MNTGNDHDNLDLTDAERAELDATTKPADDAASAAKAAADEAAAAKAAEDEAAAAAAAEAKVDPNAELRAIAQNTAAAAAGIAESAARIAASTAPKTEEPGKAKEPDWDGERKALKARHDAGELDDDTYDRMREEIVERRFDYKVDQRAQALVDKRLQEREAVTQEQDWDRSWNRFVSEPANKEFVGDATRAAAFNGTLQAVAHEMPNASYDEMLTITLARVRSAFGLKDPAGAAAAAAAQAAVDKAVAERKAAAGKTPTNIGAAPSAGVPTAGSGEETLDAMDISELEDTLAKMPADKVEAYLANAPGGLRDNPRGGAKAA